MDQGITIAIMAGGGSGRMGRDKATIELGGATLLERIVVSVGASGLPVMVVGRERPETWGRSGPIAADVAFVPDEAPGAGPIGGIVTAMRATGGDVIAVACDMPLLDREVVDFLLAASAERDPDAADGIILVREGRLEPLCSLYRRSALELLETRIASGDLSLRRAIEAGRFRRIDVPEHLAGRLRNVNTPEDLEGLLGG